MNGVKRDFNQVKQYIGDDFQLFGTERAELREGKAKGVEVIRIKNGAGLEATIVPDRALDIASLSFGGVGCSFLSKTGIVNPQFYVEDGTSGFLKNFFAGMLTTCGLTYFGAPCTDEGKQLGLHGPLSNIPAEDVCVWTDRAGDAPCIKIKGRMRQAEVFLENLVMQREYSLQFQKNTLCWEDVIINRGYASQPLMLLYHMNFGYPFLTENAVLTVAEKKCTARDEEAQKGFEERFLMQRPAAGFAEQCFFYECKAGMGDETEVLLCNPEHDFAVVIGYNTMQLGYLTEWKSMLAGDYALGIEPGNYTPMGRVHAKNRQLLQTIEPGESRSFRLSIGIIEGEENIRKKAYDIQCL